MEKNVLKMKESVLKSVKDKLNQVLQKKLSLSLSLFVLNLISDIKNNI